MRCMLARKDPVVESERCISMECASAKSEYAGKGDEEDLASFGGRNSSERRLLEFAGDRAALFGVPNVLVTL